MDSKEVIVICFIAFCVTATVNLFVGCVEKSNEQSHQEIMLRTEKQVKP